MTMPLIGLLGGCLLVTWFIAYVPDTAYSAMCSSGNGMAGYDVQPFS
jgi:hypothetical protein